MYIYNIIYIYHTEIHKIYKANTNTSERRDKQQYKNSWTLIPHF